MNSVVGNVYGDPVNGPVTIPPGYPAAGIYYSATANTGNATVLTSTAADAAMTGTGGDTPPTGPGLIPTATNTIVTITTTNSAQVATLNSYFTSMGAQVVQEKNLQSAAQIDFANLIPNNSPTVFSLINSLPGYGRDTAPNGMGTFWTGVANISTFTGQAVVATLREGVNSAALNTAGIQTNAVVPSTPSK
jgi:hypothetical protein